MWRWACNEVGLVGKGEQWGLGRGRDWQVLITKDFLGTDGEVSHRLVGEGCFRPVRKRPVWETGG